MSRLTQKEKGTSQEKILLIVRIEIQNYTAAGIEMEKGVNFEECIKKKQAKLKLCASHSIWLGFFVCVWFLFSPPLNEEEKERQGRKRWRLESIWG